MDMASAQLDLEQRRFNHEVHKYQMAIREKALDAALMFGIKDAESLVNAAETIEGYLIGKENKEAP